MSLSRWSAGLAALVLIFGSQAASAQNKLEPTAPPGPTMKTLDEIPPAWSLALPADDTGDPCNSSRFKCVLPTAAKPTGAAVLDRETGLVWERSPGGLRDWYQANDRCNNSSVGLRYGWRLPTIQELASLTGLGGLGSGHPFSFVADVAWSATTRADDPASAWILHTTFHGLAKTTATTVWCVRGGRGVDAQ